MRKKATNISLADHNRIAELIKSAQINFTEIQSKVIQLYLIEELNITEIANQNGLSVSMVKRELSKSLYTLRKVCNDNEYLKAKSILYKTIESEK